MSSSCDFDLLWETVTQQFKNDISSVHGPSHWRRVEQNGLLLALHTGANIMVVRLFAMLHDSKRING